MAGVGRGFVAGVKGESENESFVREINVAKACSGFRRPQDTDTKELCGGACARLFS